MNILNKIKNFFLGKKLTESEISIKKYTNNRGETTRIVYTIPVGGLSKKIAEEQISKLIESYKEDVNWDENLGTVQINGSTHIPYAKDFFLPTREEEFTIETIKQ